MTTTPRTEAGRNLLAYRLSKSSRTAGVGAWTAMVLAIEAEVLEDVAERVRGLAKRYEEHASAGVPSGQEHRYDIRIATLESVLALFSTEGSGK